MAEENIINNTSNNSVNTNPGEINTAKNAQPSPVNSVPPSNNQTSMNNGQTAQNKDPNKLFTGNASILGMKASILKPQTEREKQDYEKAIQKRIKKANGEPAFSLPMDKIIKALIAVVLILVIGFLVVSSKDVLKKIAHKISTVSKTKIEKPVTPKEPEVMVLEDNLQVKITTALDIDKATLVLGDKKYDGKIINKEAAGQSNTWEFIVSGLKKGKYTFKCYTKNTKTNQVNLATGGFEVK